MNPPHYMNTVWDDGHLAPQLELEEYSSPDPNAYLSHGAIEAPAPSVSHHTAPSPGHSPSFGGYNSYQPNTSFNFTVQPPQQQVMTASQPRSQGYFAAAGQSGATPSTRQQAFSAQGTVFSGSSAVQTSPNMGPTTYQEGSMFGPYPPSGPSHTGYEIPASQTHNTVFSSPPMGFPQGYQQQQSHSPYFQADMGDPYSAQHPTKRQRHEDGAFYEEHGAEEKEGGANKTDPANKRP